MKKIVKKIKKAEKKIINKIVKEVRVEELKEIKDVESKQMKGFRLSKEAAIHNLENYKKKARANISKTAKKNMDKVIAKLHEEFTDVQAKEITDAMTQISLAEARAVLILDNMYSGAPFMGKLKEFPGLRTEHAKQIALDETLKIEKAVSKMNKKQKRAIAQGEEIMSEAVM